LVMANESNTSDNRDEGQASISSGDPTERRSED